MVVFSNFLSKFAKEIFVVNCSLLFHVCIVMTILVHILLLVQIDAIALLIASLIQTQIDARLTLKVAHSPFLF